MAKRIILLALFLVLGALVLEIAGLIRLSANLKSYAAYWRSRPAEGEITYVALGDSAAQGIGASKPHRGYVGLLATHIEQRTGKRVRVVNLSVSGAKIEDVVHKQIPELTRYNPSIVTVEVGANDIVAFNQASFQEKFSALVKVLPSQTIVANMPNFGGRIKRPEAVEAANTIIAAQTKAKGLTMADLYGTTKAHESLFNYAPDLFHPNDQGYRNWEAAFWEALEPSLTRL